MNIRVRRLPVLPRQCLVIFPGAWAKPGKSRRCLGKQGMYKLMISPIKKARNQKIFSCLYRSILTSHGFCLSKLPVFASTCLFSPLQAAFFVSTCLFLPRTACFRLGRLPVFASTCLFLPRQACFCLGLPLPPGAKALTRQRPGTSPNPDEYFPFEVNQSYNKSIITSFKEIKI